MKLNLAIASFILQAALGAEIPEYQQMIVGRFNGYGDAEILLDCSQEPYTIPVLHTKTVQSLFHCASVKPLSPTNPTSVCRMSYAMDGGLEKTTQVEGNSYNWVSTWKNEVLQEAYGGDTKNFLTENALFFNSNVNPNSKFGTQSGVSTLRGTSSYYNAPTQIGAYLQTESLAAIQSLDTIKCSPTDEFLAGRTPTFQTKYSNIELDTFNAAAQALETEPGSHVMIVNFANNKNPGGGYLNGSRAQEEDLFRCSNLPWILGGLRNVKGHYPINTSLTANALFNSNCHIMRTRNRNAFFTEDQIRKYSISVCSIGAYNYRDEDDSAIAFDPAGIPADSPEGTKSSLFNNVGREGTKNRIRVMFQTAILKGVHTIILGAFGCGAFKNDPAVIVQIFNEVMQEYHNYIPNVVFAIIGPENIAAFKSLQFPQ